MLEIVILLYSVPVVLSTSALSGARMKQIEIPTVWLIEKRFHMLLA